jgi:hypothetical protein
MRGKKYDSRIGASILDLECGIDAVEPRHGKVKHGDIGFQVSA